MDAKYIGFTVYNKKQAGLSAKKRSAEEFDSSKQKFKIPALL